MKVLDLDLDFFLADCCPLAEYGQRPDVAGHEPWEDYRVREFLEVQCGLDRRNPVPGRIFETHDQALDFWEERIFEGTLSFPFEVTHVDAHSDLGIGYPGPDYVLHNVLSMKPENRIRPDFFRGQHKLDEANYLLFALAFRRISKLENVRIPKSRPDIPKQILAGDEMIRLESLSSRIFESVNGKEPVIPFFVYNDYRLFRNDQNYDYVTAAISPRYLPSEGDHLVDIVREYIREI